MQPIDCVRCGKDRMAIIMSKAMAALDIGTLEASASGDAHHGGGVSHIILWSMVVDGGRWWSIITSFSHVVRIGSTCFVYSPLWYIIVQ